MQKYLELEVTTPTRTFFNQKVKQFSFRAVDGDMTILYNHAPIMTIADIGIMHITDLEGNVLDATLFGGSVLVENNKRQFTAVEVKTDFKAHETGNLVYELSTSGNVGCFEKTNAKFIFYYIPRLRVVHVLSVSLLRKYVNERDLEAVKMGDYATGYLIPITDLEKTGVIKRTYKGVF